MGATACILGSSVCTIKMSPSKRVIDVTFKICQSNLRDASVCMYTSEMPGLLTVGVGWGVGVMGSSQRDKVFRRELKLEIQGI